MGRLEIRVCGARNIANLQKVGKPDPYVRVIVGEKKKAQMKYKTRVIEDNLNPVWNELFKFQVADYDKTQVLFELWNDNVFVDDLLGSYSLSINGLQRGVVQDVWVILTGTKRSSSELHLRILAVDFGRDPDAGAKITASLEEDKLVTPVGQSYRPQGHPSSQTTVVQQGYASAPQGVTTTVVYGAPAPPPSAPTPVFLPSSPAYGYAPPPPQMAGGYYGGPPPPQPMFAAPPPPPPQPTFFGGPPPQPLMYGPPRPAPPVQMAYGIPPD